MQDLVQLRCNSLHQVFVSKLALRTARQTGSVWEYTKSLFIDYFDPNIAVMCTVSGTNDEGQGQGNMTATLPAEFLGVFLGNFTSGQFFIRLFSNNVILQTTSAL